MTKLLTTLSILLIASAGYAQGKVYIETELKVQLPFGEANSTESSKTYTVERVIDGNTIKLTNGERVRLIGIDTPESQPNDKAKRDAERTGKDLKVITWEGMKATNYVKSYGVENGKVFLYFDVQEKDKYGRLLAYAYIPINDRLKERVEKFDKDCQADMNCLNLHKAIFPIKDSNSEDQLLFLNAFIIQSGYAEPMNIPPNVKYAELIEKLYVEGKENKRGLWINLEATLKKLPGIIHRFEVEYPAKLKEIEKELEEQRKIQEELYEEAREQKRGLRKEEEVISREGLYKEYHKSGELLGEGNWKDGKPYGEFKVYYKNGDIQIIMNYQDGKLDGSYKSYYPKGAPLREAQYQKGMLLTDKRFYDGELRLIKEYTNNKLTRKVEYDESGNITSDETFGKGE